jgi:hypothetical protein
MHTHTHTFREQSEKVYSQVVGFKLEHDMNVEIEMNLFPHGGLPHEHKHTQKDLKFNPFA